jgi:hypothetical protein
MVFYCKEASITREKTETYLSLLFAGRLSRNTMLVWKHNYGFSEKDEHIWKYRDKKELFFQNVVSLRGSLVLYRLETCIGFKHFFYDTPLNTKKSVYKVVESV